MIEVNLKQTESSVTVADKEGSFIVSPSAQSVCLSLSELEKMIPPFGCNKYDGFDIPSPYHLLVLLDEEVKNGDVTIHYWQIRFLLDFAISGELDTNPFQAILRACNGSGKDKYILAPCVVWLCMRWRRSIGIVTSSSGFQLDTQTCRYIKELAERANIVFGLKIWDCNYRKYKCNFDESVFSEIFCYATDEPGKAEGFHPTSFRAKMGIFVSEDKTVSDEINVALNKCTGYTHRIHVSTPGLPMGHFFEYDNIAIERDLIDTPKSVKDIDWIKYLVTAFQCKHIPRSSIEAAKRDLPGGEFGAAYKSQVLAEFGTTDELVVIPYTYVWQAYNNTCKTAWIPETYNKAGLDLSDGGDETVLVVRNGNKHLVTIPFKFDNTEDTVAFLNEKFREHKLDHPEAFIYADCGGMGKPILDRMVRQGWKNIRYIDNRNKPYRPKTYKNRGAELWFHLRQLFERHEIIMNGTDDILAKQLGGRYYKIVDGAIHQLLSKIEQKSKGYRSPDRADAFTLAFWDYKSTFVDMGEEAPDYTQKPYELPTEEAIKGDFTLKGMSEGKRAIFIPEQQTNFRDINDEISEYNKRVK